MEETERQTTHEAGHAVAMWYFGKGIGEVTLKDVTPSKSSPAFPAVIKLNIQSPGSAVLDGIFKRDAEVYAIIKWAGWAANVALEGLVEDHVREFGAVRDEEEVIALAWAFHADEKSVRDWSTSMQNTARELLSRDDLRSAVQQLSARLARLLPEEILPGHEAERIIAESGAHQRPL